MTNFQNIRAGFELPSLSKGPVTRQHLVEWCAAENDYYSLHYDERIAEKMGLPGTPIQGTYRYALMGQMVERWLDGRGQLKRISATYRGIDLEGAVITARGKVSSVEAGKEGTSVLIEVWIESDKGERSTSGEALVLLPGTA